MAQQPPIKPPWIRDDTPESDPSRDPVTGRFRPGYSGNPAGRKGGRWSEKLHALVPKALAAIEAALDAGDVSAVGHILSRTVPAMKAESPEVQFEFDPTGSPAQMSAQILTALSRGQLTPEAAETMQRMVATHLGLRDAETYADELAKLESRRQDRIPGSVIYADPKTNTAPTTD